MSHPKATLAVAALLFLALAALVFSCGSTATTVPLAYTYTTGQSWTYETTVVMNGTVQGPGVPADEGAIPQDTTVKVRTEATVEDLTDEVATIRLRQETLTMTAEGEPVEVGPDPVREITITLDPAGKVISVEGAEQSGWATDAVSGVLPFDPSQFIDQLGILFPEDGQAKVGETWSVTSSVPVPGMEEQVTATVKGKLVAVGMEDGRQVADIDYSVELPLDLTLDLGALLQGLMGAMGGAEQPGLAFTMTLTGDISFSSKAKIDVGTGRALRNDGDLTMDMSMEITEAPEDFVPVDQRGPFTVDLTMKVTTAEVK